MPLLCWDIANPLLGKQQELAFDLFTFAQLKADHGWQLDTDLREPLTDNQTVVITELTNRIIWVSSGFIRLTGYQPAEMIGKSPALLQGPLTSPKTRALVRQKLSRFESVSMSIQNYRKEQTPYWCRIVIQPLFNDRSECTHFIAFEKELSA